MTDNEQAWEELNKIRLFVYDEDQSDKENDDVLYGDSFSKVFRALRQADKVQGLVKALEKVSRLGHEGMKPNFNEWITFHDTVAGIADEALAAYKGNV
jgi:hypothetical protein